MKHFQRGVIVLLMLGLVALTGCTQKLSDQYDKDKLNERVDQVLEVIRSGDYDAMVLLLREDMRTEELTGAALEAIWAAKLDALGDFTKTADRIYVGMTQEQVDYAVVVAGCVYENGNAIFTLTFDPDYALVGMYLK